MAAHDQTAPLAPETPPAASESAGLRRGAVVGRYIVVDRVGSGGAGEVYSAFDSTLNRTVALKVLHGDQDEAALGLAETGGGWRRLVREARTLAQLSHPNVVTVHDVGREDGLTYIAMELVDGEDLASWIRNNKSSTLVERLRLAVAAGEGLAAAHDANIVHRDFKPANVLVGRDGRARVSDFGIARGEVEGTVEYVKDEAPSPGSTSVAGTPYYLAPEQHDGAAGDRRSDIYSFCVTLYELVHGSGPFRGKTMAAIADEKHAGPPSMSPGDTPLWLSDIISRGLRPDPHERFGSMREVLAEIARGLSRRRKRGVILAAATAGLALAAGAYVLGEADTACGDIDRHLDGVWDRDRADAVDAALTAVDLPLAQTAATQASESLDVYAKAWVEQRREVCLSADRREETQTLLDRRLACLDARRSRLEATVEILADADEGVVTNTPKLLAGLPSVERCADTTALLAEVPLPEDPQAAKEVRAVRALNQRHNATRDAGRYEAAKEVLDEMSERAAAVDHDPLTAEVRLQQGHFANDMGDQTTAITFLKEAHFTAERCSHDSIAAMTSTRLMRVIGIFAGRPDEALQWAPHAESAAARAGGGKYEVAYLVALAWVLDAASQHQEAHDALIKAIEIGERELDPGDMHLVDAYTTLGGVLVELGKPAEAIPYHERALTVVRELYGAEHPNIAKMYAAIGISHYELRDVKAAQSWFEKELELFERTLGPEHPSVATACTHLGAAAYHNGDLKSAVHYMTRSLDILRKTKEPDNQELLDSEVNLAKLHIQLGENDKALEMLRAVKPRIANSPGPKSESYLNALLAIGDAERGRGNHEAALEPHTQALALRLEISGPDHPDTLHERLAVARTQLALGKDRKALVTLQDLMTKLDATPFEKAERAEFQFAYAEALAKTGGSTAEARRIAEEALAAYQAGGEMWSESATEVERFLGTL